jgi:sensor histidine kinase YesM
MPKGDLYGKPLKLQAMKRIIVLLLVLLSFNLSYGENWNSNWDTLAKEQVGSKFARPNERPIRYYSNILILLQGYPTHEDSMIFKELVDTLNVLIDKWDVALIKNGTTNLEVGINIPYNGAWKPYFNQNYNRNEIIKSTIYLNLPDKLDFTTRKKIIYYNMLRALVVQSSESSHSVPGSIFSESSATNIHFLPLDFKIIKELYSQKYEDAKKFQPTQFRKAGVPLKPSYNLLFQSIVQLFTYGFLIFMALNGAFKNHHYEFEAYIKQGLIVIIAIAFLIGFNAFIIAYNTDSSNPYLVYLGSLIGILIIGVLIVSLIYFIEKALLENTNSFFMQIITPMLSISFVTTALSLTSMVLIQSLMPNNIRGMIYLNLLTFVCVNSILIGFGRSIFIFTNKTSENIILKKDLELAHMSALHKQAELQSLRAKINPHFLYNALNSIASLATTDGHRTEQMALSLSDFFKYAINREQKQLNTLSEELNAIRTYLEIEKVRFGDRLNFEIDCPADLLEVQIPQLLIQPLVENALKHGLSQITDKGFIKVSASKSESLLKIRVYDNGPAFPEGPLSGFGIQNTQERIALVYGAKAGIKWQNKPDKFIEISLPVNNK